MFQDVEDKTGDKIKKQISRLLETTLAVEEKALESIINGWNSISWYDPLEQMYDNQGGCPTPFQLPPPPYFRQENKRGEDVPIYTSEVQLRMLRDVSRLLCASSEYAISALENRVSYIIGEGLTYKAVPREGKQVPPQYLERVQELISFFHEFNSLDDIERESVFRMDVDGEAFVRMFPMPSGLMKLRFVEPELVTSDRAPVSNWAPEHSFGIESSPDDVEDVLGYWIIDRPLTVMTPVFVPEAEVIHLKTSNYKSAKRGRPLFYSVSRNLQRIEQLMGSLSAMAKARSKIALIRKMRGGTPAAIEKLRQAVTATQVTNYSGQTQNIEQFQDGSILTSSDNIDYEMPSANTGAAEFIEVLKAELRGVAARVVMPEWMLTSNATDMGAYTSSLVAEAPSTRMFLRLQQYFRKAYGERRLGVGKALIWRWLEHCVRTGWLDESYLYDCMVKATAPSVVVRDQNEEAQVNKTYHDMGVKSKSTIQQELGLDTDLEDRNIQKEQEQAPQQELPPPPAMEGVLEKALEGFTGTIRDSLGRTLHYQDGKRVAHKDSGDLKASKGLVAPKGGATVAGTTYQEGDHIPHDVVKAMTPQARAQLEAKLQVKGERKADNKTPEQHKADAKEHSKAAKGAVKQALKNLQGLGLGGFPGAEEAIELAKRAQQFELNLPEAKDRLEKLAQSLGKYTVYNGKAEKVKAAADKLGEALTLKAQAQASFKKGKPQKTPKLAQIEAAKEEHEEVTKEAKKLEGVSSPSAKPLQEALQSYQSTPWETSSPQDRAEAATKLAKAAARVAAETGGVEDQEDLNTSALEIARSANRVARLLKEVIPAKEAILEKALEDGGFTGTITDSAGRKRAYQNGKQVALTQEQPSTSKPAEAPKANEEPQKESPKSKAPEEGPQAPTPSKEEQGSLSQEASAEVLKALPEEVQKNPSLKAKVKKYVAKAFLASYQAAHWLRENVDKVVFAVLDTPEEISNPYIYGAKSVGHGDLTGLGLGINPWVACKIATALAGVLAKQFKGSAPAQEAVPEGITPEQLADYLIYYHSAVAKSLGITLHPDREGLVKALSSQQPQG